MNAWYLGFVEKLMSEILDLNDLPKDKLLCTLQTKWFRNTSHVATEEIQELKARYFYDGCYIQVHQKVDAAKHITTFMIISIIALPL
jgi:hypothetical protein